MGATVEELRVSFTWFETNPDLIAGRSASGAVWTLGTEQGYKDAFEEASSGQGLLLPPWHIGERGIPRGRNHFWEAYLKAPDEDLSRVTWESAQRLTMPFRCPSGLKVKKPDRGLSVRFQLFVYPHGSAVVAWVELDCGKGSMELAAAVDRIVTVRSETLTATWDDGTVVTGRLHDLARAIFGRMRTARLGDDEAQSLGPAEPFSVAVVVRGSGVDPGTPIEEFGPTHRALNGLCRFDERWDSRKPSPLAEATLAAEGSIGAALYRTRRGRAAWFPETFEKDATKACKLSCYSRNLTMLSMQIEAMRGLVAWASGQLSQPGSQGLPAFETRTTEAANALVRLYGTPNGPVVDTYRSRSATAQINDSDALDHIHVVRRWKGDASVTPVSFA